ncbi:hypothetical protein QQX98_000941 [Neonectria punicea]|uniref:Extracellular membrane protein CFEM domain-containing protein n=1 Tax=Neonectria punicea TaxID=979145 RepID=A0ABR1HT29_9HYPO
MASTSTFTSTSSSPACSNLYDPPIKDAACAMPYSAKHADFMLTCCKEADVVSYYDDCGLYCLAIGQNVNELIKCLYKNGADWGDVFCQGNASATATETGGEEIPASASASIISSGIATNTEGSKSGSKSSATASEGAAPGVKQQSGVTVLGVAIGTLLFSATAFGAFLV